MELERDYIQNWEKQGWMDLVMGTTERKFWIVSESSLFFFNSDKDQYPSGIIPLEELHCEVDERLQRITLKPPAHKSKLRTIQNGTLELVSKLVLHVESKNELRQWFSFLRQNIVSGVPRYN